MKLRGSLGAIEHAASLVALALLTALPLIEIGGRALFGRGIAGSIPVAQHLTLWVTLLGGALAAGTGRLLALSTASFLPERFQTPVRAFTAAAGCAVATALSLASVQLVRVTRETGDTIAWGIPAWAALAIMPAGFAAIAWRILWGASGRWRGRFLAALGLAVPLVLLVPGFDQVRLLLPGAVLLVIATALGLPIFAALGGAALLLFWSEQSPLASVPFDFYRLAAHPMLPAIPLFTLGGYILAEGGASKRLLRTFAALVGWMPGGLAIVTTLVLAFFTPFTGASGVTILSMGGLFLPVLVKAGYPEKSSIGLVTVSGSIGLLLPPSLPVILYGIFAKQPIDRMFKAGLLPGLLLILAVAGWGATQGWFAGAKRTPFRVREAAAALWEAKWELLLPPLVLVSYFGGYATLVETAALTVLYALVVGCLVWRDLSPRRDLLRVAIESATLAGGFLIILGVALGFTNYLIQAEIPMHTLAWVRTHVESPIVFLLALNVFLVVVGALMDIYSAIFVIVPLITPIGAAYGIDPVHLGVIFLANMELGYLMPPMGENLFLSSYRFHQPLSRIYVSTLPFLLMLAIVVLLITYVPALTLQ